MALELHTLYDESINQSINQASDGSTDYTTRFLEYRD